MGYSSGQPERLNTRHQSEVQSLEISIMAREKHCYAVLLEGVCKGNKKVTGKGKGLYLAPGREMNIV